MWVVYTPPESKSVSTILPAAFYLYMSACVSSAFQTEEKKTTYSNSWQKTEKNIRRSTRFTAKHKCKRIRVNEKSDMHAVRETNNNNSNINCKWLKLYAPNIQIKGHVYFPLISFRCCCLLSLLMPFVIHKTCSCFFRVYTKWSANIILSCAIKQCLLYLDRYHMWVCVREWLKKTLPDHVLMRVSFIWRSDAPCLTIQNRIQVFVHFDHGWAFDPCAFFLLANLNIQIDETVCGSWHITKQEHKLL